MKTFVKCAEYFEIVVGITQAKAILKKTQRGDGSIVYSAGMSAEEDYIIQDDDSIQTRTTISKSVIVLKSHPEDPFLLNLEALSTRSKKTMKLKDPFRYSRDKTGLSRMRFTLAIAEYIAFEFVGAHTLKLQDAATTFIGPKSNLYPLSILVWPVKGQSIQGSYGQTTDSKNYRRLCRMLPRERPCDMSKRIRTRLTQDKAEYIAMCNQLETCREWNMKDTSLWDLCVRQWITDLDSSQDFFSICGDDARRQFQFWQSKSKDVQTHDKLTDKLSITIDSLHEVPSWLRSYHDRWTDTF